MARPLHVAMLSGTLALALLSGCAAPPPPDGRERPSTASSRAGQDDQGPAGRDVSTKGPVSEGWRVVRVVDGDTVEVTRGARSLTLRLIGIDTPETVHPTEPIECFGPESSDFATRLLLGEPVTLEFDPSQGRLDYYDRTLAYVWTGRTMFNRTAVRRGYALEYTYDTPYRWQREFLRAEATARGADLGVWRCPRPGS